MAKEQRLIDANAIDYENIMGSLSQLRWLNAIIESRPTVDAVEVVRCKDCKHRGDAEECPMRYFETDRSYDCDGHIMLDYFDHDFTKGDGFCDRGEGRTDNDNK